MPKMKNPDYYLSLNYRTELIRDKDNGGFFANHPDLEGCFAQGETADEAVTNLEGAREAWIRARIEDSLPIPEPLPEEPSGRFLLRIPPWLHGQALKAAQHQGVSLNQLVSTALAEKLGGEPEREAISQLNAKVSALASLVLSRATQPIRQAEEIAAPFLTLQYYTTLCHTKNRSGNWSRLSNAIPWPEHDVIPGSATGMSAVSVDDSETGGVPGSLLDTLLAERSSHIAKGLKG